jgi:hypothetical protein
MEELQSHQCRTQPPCKKKERRERGKEGRDEGREGGKERKGFKLANDGEIERN